MKTPEEIKKFRREVIELLEWALEQEHITKEQFDILKPEVIQIELDMYPKKMVNDENGWPQIASEWVDGKPIDEWE